MKKGWLHAITISCVCNGVAVTIMLFFFFYEIIPGKTAYTFPDYLGIFVAVLAFAIYLVSDIWGIRLYNRLKNFDSISLIDKGNIKVLLFFLALLQICMGCASSIVLRNIIQGVPSNFEINDSRDIIKYLILVVFFTGLIVLSGHFFLFKSFNTNKKKINEEIENIGRT